MNLESCFLVEFYKYIMRLWFIFLIVKTVIIYYIGINELGRILFQYFKPIYGIGTHLS